MGPERLWKAARLYPCVVTNRPAAPGISPALAGLELRDRRGDPTLASRRRLGCLDLRDEVLAVARREAIEERLRFRGSGERLGEVRGHLVIVGEVSTVRVTVTSCPPARPEAFRCAALNEIMASPPMPPMTMPNV